MEEKREEARQHMLEEKDRTRDAKKKEESWALMRESVAFLRTNADRWRERKIDECDRTREEEKKDRKSVVMEKKRKYGIKRFFFVI
jgi:predicted metal-dependent hydrolase